MESASSTKTKKSAKSAKGTYSIIVTTGTLVATGHYPAMINTADTMKKLGQDYIPEYRIVLPNTNSNFNSNTNSDTNRSGIVCYLVNHVAYFLGYRESSGRAKTNQIEFFIDCLDGTVDSSGLVTRLGGIPPNLSQAS